MIYTFNIKNYCKHLTHFSSFVLYFYNNASLHNAQSSLLVHAEPVRPDRLQTGEVDNDQRRLTHSAFLRGFGSATALAPPFFGMSAPD